jgi:hypothetical protein
MKNSYKRLKDLIFRFLLYWLRLSSFTIFEAAIIKVK